MNLIKSIKNVNDGKRNEELLGIQLFAVGMGTTSTKHVKLPNQLIETRFTENVFESVIPDHGRWCLPHNICTDRITEGSNICTFDDGGPLFELDCISGSPKCLYGVASYHIQDPAYPNELCTGGSVFARIPSYFNWALQTIALN